ncbi:hypothetical protein BGZ98_008477 [Dissophora globulifera]|nr:hypothetical protein BGZ98_008477 [Dissophora globulifera]
MAGDDTPTRVPLRPLQLVDSNIQTLQQQQPQTPTKTPSKVQVDMPKTPTRTSKPLSTGPPKTPTRERVRAPVFTGVSTAESPRPKSSYSIKSRNRPTTSPSISARSSPARETSTLHVEAIENWSSAAVSPDPTESWTTTTTAFTTAIKTKLQPWAETSSLESARLDELIQHYHDLQEQLKRSIGSTRQELKARQRRHEDRTSALQSQLALEELACDRLQKQADKSTSRSRALTEETLALQLEMKDLDKALEDVETRRMGLEERRAEIMRDQQEVDYEQQIQAEAMWEKELASVKEMEEEMQFHIKARERKHEQMARLTRDSEQIQQRTHELEALLDTDALRRKYEAVFERWMHEATESWQEELDIAEALLRNNDQRAAEKETEHRCIQQKTEEVEEALSLAEFGLLREVEELDHRRAMVKALTSELNQRRATATDTAGRC